jgi:hypothetical protein
MQNGYSAFRREFPKMDVIAMMTEVLSGHPKYSAYVVLKELFAIAHSLTFCTSIAESGYSVINALKNYNSNAMGDPTLDYMLNILFNGPPELPVFLFCFVLFLCFE